MKRKFAWSIPCLIAVCIVIVLVNPYFKNDQLPLSNPNEKDDVSEDGICPYAIRYDGVTYYSYSGGEPCLPESQLQLYQTLGTIKTSVPITQMPAQDFETNLNWQQGLTVYRVDRAILLLNHPEQGAWYCVPKLIRYNGAYYWASKTVILSQEDQPAEETMVGSIQSTVPGNTCPVQDMESNGSGDQGRKLYRINDHILLRHDAGVLYTCFYLYE